MHPLGYHRRHQVSSRSDGRDSQVNNCFDKALTVFSCFGLYTEHLSCLAICEKCTCTDPNQLANNTSTSTLSPRNEQSLDGTHAFGCKGPTLIRAVYTAGRPSSQPRSMLLCAVSRSVTSRPPKACIRSTNGVLVNRMK